MQKITSYEIIQASTSWELQKNVVEYMKFGWQPQGGLCYAEGDFYQVIVKYEVEELQSDN
jgi:hypothetical protein